MFISCEQIPRRRRSGNVNNTDIFGGKKVVNRRFVNSAYNTNVLAHFGCTKFIVRQTDIKKCLKEEKKEGFGIPASGVGIKDGGNVIASRRRSNLTIWIAASLKLLAMTAWISSSSPITQSTSQPITAAKQYERFLTAIPRLKRPRSRKIIWAGSGTNSIQSLLASKT